ERARHVRKRVHQMLNSRGEWEVTREPQLRPVREVVVPDDVLRSAYSVSKAASGDVEASSRNTQYAIRDTQETPQISDFKFQVSNFRPALSVPAALEKVGVGTLCVLNEQDGQKTYGREVTVADRLGHDRVILAKWIRRLTNWNGRQAPLALWKE